MTNLLVRNKICEVKYSRYNKYKAFLYYNFIYFYYFSDLAEYRDVVGDISIALDNDDDESDSIVSSSMSPSKQSTNAPSTGNLAVEFFLWIYWQSFCLQGIYLKMYM